MQWKAFKDELPTGKEHAVLVFPEISDVGILYTVSNPHFVIKHHSNWSWTHWCEVIAPSPIDLANAILRCEAVRPPMDPYV